MHTHGYRNKTAWEDKLGNPHSSHLNALLRETSPTNTQWSVSFSHHRSMANSETYKVHSFTCVCVCVCVWVREREPTGKELEAFL